MGGRDYRLKQKLPWLSFIALFFWGFFCTFLFFLLFWGSVWDSHSLLLKLSISSKSFKIDLTKLPRELLLYSNILLGECTKPRKCFQHQRTVYKDSIQGQSKLPGLFSCPWYKFWSTRCHSFIKSSSVFPTACCMAGNLFNWEMNRTDGARQFILRGVLHHMHRT